PVSLQCTTRAASSLVTPVRSFHLQSRDVRPTGQLVLLVVGFPSAGGGGTKTCVGMVRSAAQGASVYALSSNPFLAHARTKSGEGPYCRTNCSERRKHASAAPLGCKTLSRRSRIARAESQQARTHSPQASASASAEAAWPYRLDTQLGSD